VTFILNRSAKQWLLLAALILVEAAVLISLMLTVPEVSEGTFGWLIWIVVIGINVLFTRRFFAPQDQQLR
jgi:hypothetical protein